VPYQQAQEDRITEPYSKNTLKSDQNLNPREQRSGSMHSIICQTGPIVASCNEYLSLQGKKKHKKKVQSSHVKQ